jgi:hypothetical protein
MANSGEKNRVAAALDYLRSHNHYFRFDDHERVVEVVVTDGANVDEIAAHVSNLSDLEKLTFFGTGLTDSALCCLAGLVRLTEFWIDGSGFTSIGLAQLERLSKLEDLYIGDARGLDLAAFACLARLPNLRKLTLRGGSVSDADLTPLAALVNLEELSLSDCDEVHGTFCKDLTDLLHLKILDLGEQVTDEGLASIATLSDLLELFITGPFTDAGLAQLIALKNVATLAVDSDYVSAEGISVITQLPKLNCLYLDTPRLSDGAVPALLRCSLLETMTFTNSGLSQVGLQQLRDGLPRCSVQDPSQDEPLEFDTPVDHTNADRPRMDTNAPFLTLLAKACDLDLVDGTFSKIGDRYKNRIDTTQYSHQEGVIMLVWHSACCIDFGGFEYLFVRTIAGDPDFRITAEAYKTAGLDRDYEAFQEAFKLFPRGTVPHDLIERYHLFQASNQSARDQINLKFRRGGFDGSREKKLAEFIRKNAARLGDLDSTS